MDFLLGNPFSSPVGQRIGKAREAAQPRWMPRFALLRLAYNRPEFGFTVSYIWFLALAGTTPVGGTCALQKWASGRLGQLECAVALIGVALQPMGPGKIGRPLKPSF